jgi:lysozyme
MTPSKNCLDLIKQFEGCQLKAYLCPASIATVGWGTIMYPDGIKVKLGDTITAQEADLYLSLEVGKKAATIIKWGLNINQNQLDALVSFAFNLGIGALLKSTLLKKVKVNPNDPTIKDEFMRWVNKGSSFEKGLTRRRKAESDLYFTV